MAEDGKKKAKGFFAEFKKFISKGNVMDMAVGLIIGSAFTAIVNSLVDDIISPLLGLFGDMNFDQLMIQIGGVTISYGKFLTAVINFILIALVLFIMVKILNDADERAKKLVGLEEKPAAPTTKICPYCKSEIAIDATRCPHCTSQLETADAKKKK